MNIEQKIIGICIPSSRLAEELNKYSAEGWQVQQVSAKTGTQRGGAIYNDSFYLVLNKSDSHISYRCLDQKRCISEDDFGKLNATIIEQNQEGYRLAHLLHGNTISVSGDSESLGLTTFPSILIFEKEE